MFSKLLFNLIPPISSTDIAGGLAVNYWALSCSACDWGPTCPSCFNFPFLSDHTDFFHHSQYLQLHYAKHWHKLFPNYLSEIPTLYSSSRLTDYTYPMHQSSSLPQVSQLSDLILWPPLVTDYPCNPVIPITFMAYLTPYPNLCNSSDGSQMKSCSRALKCKRFFSAQSELLQLECG